MFAYPWNRRGKITPIQKIMIFRIFCRRFGACLSTNPKNLAQKKQLEWMLLPMALTATLYLSQLKFHNKSKMMKMIVQINIILPLIPRLGKHTYLNVVWVAFLLNRRQSIHYETPCRYNLIFFSCISMPNKYFKGPLSTYIMTRISTPNKADVTQLANP